MYKRILAVNRADCALRLIQACHLENIQVFLAAARDDETSEACKAADGVIFTGLSRDAYTNEDDILEAAIHCNCEAILPGWGFLSEEYAFARKCRLMGFHFIGPSSEHLQIFGDKLKTIQVLASTFEQPQTAISCALPDAQNRIQDEIKGPIMLKCRFGGGGKNISRFDSFSAFKQRLVLLNKTHTAAQYFAEPAVDNARHVEFQYFGDGCGNVVLLGARDCTLQKFHQKYFEFSIDLADSPKLQQLAERIRLRLSQIKYASWGTVETLVKPDNSVQLLELNPRLQVEHGVTEMASHIDIVRSAIRTSCHGKLSICPQYEHSGCDSACEFRLFARSTGTIRKIGFSDFSWPEHRFTGDPEYRIETAYREGDNISGVYDGLIARFILSGHKSEIRGKMQNWLDGFKLDGIDNNLIDLPE